MSDRVVYRQRCPGWPAVIAAILLAGPLATHTASTARAAAFQLQDNAVGLGTAFAGVRSAANSPATAFDNPAGMTRLPGLQVALGGTLIAPSAVFRGSARTAFGQNVMGVGGSDAGDLVGLLWAYVTYQPVPGLAVGLSVNTPFGLSTAYEAGFLGRYQGEKSDLTTINVNPSVAYQILPFLSVGAGVSAQYGRAVLTSAINSATVATLATGQAAALPDGQSRFSGDNWAFGYNAGLLLTPGPGTSIGATYRSRVQQDFSGTADFTVPAPLALSPAFRNGAAAAKLVLPDTAGISLTQALGESWTVYADVAWTNWSQVKTLDVFRNDGTLLSSSPQHYDNSFFASLGASYRWNDRLVVRGGTAYDKSPVSNAYRDVRVPDQSRIWLAAGFSYDVLPGATVDAGYAHIFAPGGRITETSATLDVLTGRYRSHVDVFSLGTRLRF